MITTTNIHHNVKVSLLKMCNDFIVANSLIVDNFESFDFDSHAGIQDLPNVGLIGIGEFALSEDVEMHTGDCMVMLSTPQDDTNLKILAPLVSKMYDNLAADKIFDLVNDTSGETIGKIKLFNGTTAMPVAFTKSRPLHVIGISFSVTLNQTP